MRVAVCGGGLQGVEICFLARMAGWETLLLDKRQAPPARGLANDFLCADVTSAPISAEILSFFARADIVLPALENDPALAALAALCQEAGKPFAHDATSYAVSSSKLRSREFFLDAGIRVPSPCRSPAFPMIAKPSAGSGSQGVRLLLSPQELFAAFPKGAATPEWIFEQYCPGPSYSVEVCGVPGQYTAHPVTDLDMDGCFDCKRVTAPSTADIAVQRELSGIALLLAKQIGLRGIMDVEAVAGPEGLRVLEIDARFPSQTPIAIYAATGINLLVEWVGAFLPKNASCPTGLSPKRTAPGYALLEHLYCDGKTLSTRGEHVLAACGPLRLYENLHGADFLLLGESAKGRAWAATLVCSGENPAVVEDKKRAFLAHCMYEYGLRGHTDDGPPMPADLPHDSGALV